MNSQMRTSLIILLVSAFAASLGGCGRSQGKGGNPPPPEVSVSLPVSREITDYVNFTGHMEATKTVVIRARVSGYLQKVLFKEGAEVHEGDPLFEIDRRTYQADYNRALANLNLAKAHLTRMEANYKRAKDLIEKQAISQQDFDQAVGDRDEAAATVGVADAALNSSDLNLTWTRVIAPISGRISRQLIDPGNMVKADDTALTTIVTQDPMYAYFDVDERTALEFRRLIQSGKVKSARQFEIKIRAGLVDEAGYPHEGTIDFVDNVVDMPTGTLRLRGVFPNPDNILKPGLFVRVQVPKGDPHESLMVEERALNTDQGKKFVYVVNEKDEVVRRDVELGSLNDGLRVIQRGLSPKDRVILSGLQSVKRGMKVTVAAADAPARSPGTEPADKGKANSGTSSSPTTNPARAASPKTAEKRESNDKSAAML
jgi:RND family efflux transporter MFP subunit